MGPGGVGYGVPEKLFFYIFGRFPDPHQKNFSNFLNEKKKIQLRFFCIKFFNTFLGDFLSKKALKKAGGECWGADPSIVRGGSSELEAPPQKKYLEWEANLPHNVETKPRQRVHMSISLLVK